jgi:hypothetical protein
LPCIYGRYNYAATSPTTLDGEFDLGTGAGTGGLSAEWAGIGHDSVAGPEGCALFVYQGTEDALHVQSDNGAAIIADGYPAIQAEGDVAFRGSGRLVVPAGASKVTCLGNVSGDNGVQVTIGPNSLIFATIQQNRPGVFVQAAVPSSTGVTAAPPLASRGQARSISSRIWQSRGRAKSWNARAG